MTTENLGSEPAVAEAAPVDSGGDSTLMGGAITPEQPVVQPDTIGHGSAEAGLQAGIAAEQKDWRTGLPTELQGNPALAKYTDVGALAKAYINAEKAIGADKIVMPDKHATADDLKAIFHKLGLPQKMEEYELKMPEVPLNDGDLTEFKQAAFEAGIMPNQMQQFLGWYSQRQNNHEKAETEKYDRK
jgi:hypothetical protein